MPEGPWQRLLLPWEHPRKTLQSIDTAYRFEELIELMEEARLRIVAIQGREFVPYLMVGLMSRVYRNLILWWLEPVLKRIRPVRPAYRLFIECRR